MDRNALAKALFESLCEAKRFEKVADPKWDGVVGSCHENVDRWIAMHPDDRPVRGYSVISSTDSFAHFDLHSVVERRDGSLIDVTPPPYCHPFIMRPMSETDFNVCKRYFSQITYPTNLSVSDIFCQNEDDPDSGEYDVGIDG